MDHINGTILMDHINGPLLMVIYKLYTGGCLFSREKAVKDVKSRVRFCFLVGVILDLDWLRKN